MSTGYGQVTHGAWRVTVIGALMLGVLITSVIKKLVRLQHRRNYRYDDAPASAARVAIGIEHGTPASEPAPAQTPVLTLFLPPTRRSPGRGPIHGVLAAEHGTDIGSPFSSRRPTSANGAREGVAADELESIVGALSTRYPDVSRDEVRAVVYSTYHRLASAATVSAHLIPLTVNLARTVLDRGTAAGDTVVETADAG